MKKIFVYFLLLFIPMTIVAQNEHLDFMGIPMNKTVKQFKKILLKKNLTLDDKYNNECKEPELAFRTTYEGRKARVFLHYDEKSKMVWRIYVIFECKNEAEMLALFPKFKQKAMQTPQPFFERVGEVHNYEYYQARPKRFAEDTKMVWNRCKGSIDVYMEDMPEFGCHGVLICFTDQINKDKFNK